ncbi:hypothetical protein [Anaerofustis sp.]|uniref:hypothetical protein n=1 Tax=Anaerofustis sp. TaxID=1872517 RepID=UPI0025B8513A|nr:hypothetical protein [Anaerofustis sp.]
MKLRDYGYREYERKFVKVNNGKEEFLLKLGLEDIEFPFVGYLYIDDKRGITMRIIGNGEEENPDRYINDRVVLASYDLIEDLEIEILEEFSDIDSSQAENHLKLSDENKTIYKVRERKEIDSLRSRIFPDEAEVVIPYKEGYVEKIWVKSFDYIEKEGIYIFSMLKDSVYDENLKKGCFIACRYFKKEKSEALIFMGKVEVI